MNSMKIVVTGGAGFIGSAVIRHLIKETPHFVVNLDKLTYAGNLESLDEVIEKIEEGEMPLNDYLLLHGEARLTADEKQALIEGFKRTFTAAPPVEKPRRRRPQPTE